MNIIIYILLLFVPVKDEIKYSHIKWSDFIEVPSLVDAKAESSTAISMYFEQGKTKASAIFYRNNSFVVKGSQTKYLLNHEQSHFDITYIYANKLEQKLKICNTDIEEKSAYDQVIKEWDEFQDEYDKVTEHSVNEIEQAIWDVKIDNLLNKL